MFSFSILVLTTNVETSCTDNIPILKELGTMTDLLIGISVEKLDSTADMTIDDLSFEELGFTSDILISSTDVLGCTP